MRVKKRTVWIIVAVLLVILVLLAIWQLDNIKAGILYFKYTQEEVEQQLKASDAVMESATEKLPVLSLRMLTQTERDQIQSGELTQEEAVARMLSQTGPTDTETNQAPADTVQSSGTQPEASVSSTGPPVSEQTTDTSQGKNEPPAEALDTAPAQPTVAEAEQSQGTDQIVDSAVIQSPETGSAELTEERKALDRIAELVAQVYVMRDSYIFQLETIKDTMLEEYLSLPEDQRSRSKLRFTSSCISQGSALEEQCDAEMDSILAEIRALLEQVGGDLTAVDDIKAAYANEKALTKAYYLNLYA